MIDHYTRLLEATAELEDTRVADEAVSKLIQHLKSAGRMKLLPKIARELQKIVARRHALRPKVEVAYAKDSSAALHAAAQEGIVVQQAQVNPVLIHGWRAQKDGLLIDRSGKRVLMDIYQKVTL